MESVEAADSSEEHTNDTVESMVTEETETSETVESSKASDEDTCSSTTSNNETETEPDGQENLESKSPEAEGAKASRELKSILALSKEAKLQTNISHKRKSLEPSKVKDRDTPDIEKELKKGKEGKITKFPVTAESELEESFDQQEEGAEKHIATKAAKRKKDSLSESSTGGASDESSKKGRKSMAKPAAVFKEGKDGFCWRCHREDVDISCETCPRSFHQKCLKQTVTDINHWPCPECVAILKAESTHTRSPAMKDMTLDHLCVLLKFALKRMVQCSGTEPFMHSVNEKEFPDYKNYIIQPMDLTLLEKNIKNNLYGSTQAFEADAKWILHNSIVFNSFQSKLTTIARAILKICKQEMAEIENCATCYLNANTKKDTWFVEVCPKPHLLLWAKLKGFPYWPAKYMSTNPSGMVDVRFFGAHDRAWVSYKDCYVYSLKDPNSYKQKRSDIDECIKELNVYVDNLKKVFGDVCFAPFKTPLDPDCDLIQLKTFLPKYKPPVKIQLNPEEETEPEYTIKKTNGKSEESEEWGSDEDDKMKKTSRTILIIRKDKGGEDTYESESKVIAKSGCFPSGKFKVVSRRILNSATIKTLADTNKILIDKNDKGDLKDLDKGKIFTSNALTKLENTFTYTNSKLSKRCEKNESKVSSSIKTDISESIQANSEEEKPETKLNPVQVNVEGNELSLVPSKKLAITDSLIKRLSDCSESSKGYDTKTESADSSSQHSASSDHKDTEKVELKENPEDTDKPTSRKQEEDDQGICDSTENAEEGSTPIPEVKQVEIASTDEDALDPSLIDENNIRNIIHSSLNTPKKPCEDTKAKNKTLSSKRKLSCDGETVTAQNKVIKVISVDNIDRSEIIRKSEDLAKEAKESRTNLEVNIKTEPESEDFNDVEYMEKKRKYLSALNISEKSDVPDKPKPKEIRTRSKTEERKEKQKEIDKEVQIIDNNKKVERKSMHEAKEVQIKPFANVSVKQRARKSFPAPSYSKIVMPSNEVSLIKRPRVEENKKKAEAEKPASVAITSVSSKTESSLPQGTFTSLESIGGTSGSLVILTQNSKSKDIVLVPNQAIYSSSTTNPVISMIPALASLPSIQAQPLQVSKKTITKRPASVTEAQNEASSDSNDQANGEASETTSNGIGEEIINNVLPDRATKAVSELLCKTLPKLKPRPPGALSCHFEETISNNAGPINAKINSIAHRLTDYFRGMLVETLSDVGKCNNPEATITALRLELETVKHKHELEIAEIKKNISTILKDIQKSIVEERDRIISDTRAACEAEAIKRVEEAKSKQWCANCFKESQFYCCWNTSYCDYPCQQKHWPKHMNNCTQNQASAQVKGPGQQVVLRPMPKHTALGGTRPIYPKPLTKAVNRAHSAKNVAGFKSTPSGRLAIVEKGGGEAAGSNGAVPAAKLATSMMINQLKSSNVTVTAPSTSQQPKGAANSQTTVSDEENV